MDWEFLSLQNSKITMLKSNTNVVLLGGGAFGK